jgi:putative oxidoreductase
MCNAFASFGLLLMRLAAGAMMAAGHGWMKYQSFDDMAKMMTPMFGLDAKQTLMLAIFGELVCPILVALGFLSRLAALATAFTMGVAIYTVHWKDPVFMPFVEHMKDAGAKEMAIMYMIPFATLVFTGPGKLSIDGLLFRRRKTQISTPVAK